MRLIVTGDWQMAVSNLDRCHAVVEQILQLLITRPSPRFFLHLGDIKEHNHPDQRVHNAMTDYLQQIGSSCDGVFYVRGNHDNCQTQDGTPSCIPIVESALASSGVQQYMVADDDWTSCLLGTEATRLWMVPYFRDPERQRRCFAEAAHSASLSKAKTKILAFHNELEGCERSAYSKGVGLTVQDIHAAEYNLCLGGHIHKPQFLKPNIHYVGSPFPCDWSEVNIEHRLLLVEV